MSASFVLRPSENAAAHAYNVPLSHGIISSKHVQYEHGEPCLVCGHTSFEGRSSTMPPSAIPSEVIAGHLFLGSYDHASRCDMLKMLGIEYILNVSDQFRLCNAASVGALAAFSVHVGESLWK